MTFSDQPRPTTKNGSFHFLFLSPIPQKSECNILKRRSRATNRFVKMERQISDRVVRSVKVDLFQRWSFFFPEIFRSDLTVPLKSNTQGGLQSGLSNRASSESNRREIDGERSYWERKVEKWKGKFRSDRLEVSLRT